MDNDSLLEKPSCYIFDIDGTLAKLNGRSPYDYSKVIEDLPREKVINMVDILQWEYDIIICSWRPDSCKEDTELWLRTNKIKYHWLYLRKTWDKRSDVIVKTEMLQDIIKIYNIEWIFEDRDRVVEMWRSHWYQCYQVNYGNF